jgi:hypothetical protein
LQATATTSSYRSSGVAVFGPSFPFLLLLCNCNDVTAFVQRSGRNTLALYLFHALSSSSNWIGLKDSAISVSERLAAASVSAFSFGFSYQLSAISFQRQRAPRSSLGFIVQLRLHRSASASAISFSAAHSLFQLRLQRSASASAISFQRQRAPCGSFGFIVQPRLQLSAFSVSERLSAASASACFSCSIQREPYGCFSFSAQL